MQKPEKLYHGSSRKISDALKPVLRGSTADHVHSTPAVFATARKDIAAVFMFPLTTLASVGFEQDIAYICIWGSMEEFKPKDQGGFMYILPSANFEKVGKEYEWQAFHEVMPVEVQEFKSVVDGMMECGAQVYFINDEALFDRIVSEKDRRAPILRQLISENQ